MSEKRNGAARRLRDVETRWNAERAARELAEADNAALLEGITAFHEAWKSGRDTLALAALLRLAKGAHPGAALLEYVRALEEVRMEARQVILYGGDLAGVRAAIEAVDALGKKR